MVKKVNICLVAVLAILGMSMISCNSDTTSSSGQSAVPLAEVQAERPVLEVGIGTDQFPNDDNSVLIETCTGELVNVIQASGALYADGTMDSATAEYLEQTCLIGCVQENIARFEAEGYELRLDLSLLVEGAGVPEETTDTIEVTIAEIAMIHEDWDSNGLEAYIRYTRYNPGEADVVQTSVITFKDPGDDSFDSTYIGEADGEAVYAWTIDYDPCLKYRFQPLAVTGSWYQWAKCTLIGTASICVGAAASCAVLGPGYLVCLAAGCVGGLFASAVACGLAQL